MRVRGTTLRDADQFALIVDKRPARITGVCRRVGLHHFRPELHDLPFEIGLPGLLIDLAHLPRGIHPQRSAAPRIADAVDRLTGIGAAVGEFDFGGTRGDAFEADNRQVGRTVDFNHFAVDAERLAAVLVVGLFRDRLVVLVGREKNRCPLIFPDDVIIGQHQPGRLVDERPRPRRQAAPSAVRMNPDGRFHGRFVDVGRGLLPRLTHGGKSGQDSQRRQDHAHEITPRFIVDSPDEGKSCADPAGNAGRDRRTLVFWPNPR